MHARRIRFASLWFALLLTAGCASLAVRPPSTAEKGSEAMRPGNIVDTSNGKIISEQMLIEELARVRIVYAGEMHTVPEDHRIQFKLLSDLRARNESVVLAMEMFPREVQPILDRYTRGELSEEEFLKEVRWEKIWGYPFPLYRDLLTFARDHRLKIVGLNAPGEVVQKIARSGLQSLSPEDRARVAKDFHLVDPAHRTYLRSQFQEHARGSIRDFDSFFEAQLAWEETMSETLAALAKELPEGTQILVIIGKGHIAGRVGVPALTFQRSNQPFKTVAPLPLDYPSSVDDPDIADYVWVVDKYETPHRGRLGVMIRELEDRKGLEVMGVVPGGPGEQAGIRKGDVIRRVNGKDVATLEELHKALAGGSRTHSFTLKRGGGDVTVSISIEP